jgi:hypothetical protein
MYKTKRLKMFIFSFPLKILNLRQFLVVRPFLDYPSIPCRPKNEMNY